MNVSLLAKELNLKRVSGELSPDREVTGCYIGDLLSLAMSRCKCGDVWITVQGNINVAAICTLTDAAMLIVAEGMSLDNETRVRAEKEGLHIFESSLSAYELACKIKEMI